MTSLSIPLAPATTSAVVARPDIEQHSIARSVALHLLPGLAGLVVFLASAPILASAGWPPLFAFYGPMSVTVVAVEATWLLRERRRRRDNGSRQPVIGYRRRLGPIRFVSLAAGLVVVGIVLTGGLSAIDSLVAGALFASLPAWWLVADPSVMADAPRALLVATFATGLVMNGFIGPIVEESYFRGYLLPRLSRLGRWAPILNAALFSLYHFWQPWALISRLGYVLPYAVAVQRTRSVYLGMAVHCAANVLGLLVLASIVLR